MDAAASTVHPIPEGRSEEQNTPLNSLLHTLKLQASAALEDDSRVKREVENARRVLVRTAEAASGALERLSYAEEQLEYKWAKLATLLNEVKVLEEERYEALMLAQQLAGLEPEILPVRLGEEDELGSHDVDIEAPSTPVVVPLETSRPSPSAAGPVADLRAAVKYVVQVSSASRLSR